MEAASGVIDDITVQRMGLQLAKDLFSNLQNFGKYAGSADRFVYRADGLGTLDVKLWEDKTTALTSTTVYVKTGAVSVQDVNSVGGASQFPTTGGRLIAFIESFNLVFSVHSMSGTEARTLSRILLDYLLGFSRVLIEKTGNRIMKFEVQGKSEPAKGKEQDNSDNVWVSDVTVTVDVQSQFEFKEVTPVLADVTLKPSAKI